MIYVDSLLERYRQRGLLLDTNLTVLLIVGEYRLDLIGPSGFKRVSSYLPSDWKLLVFFRSIFSGFVTTPHILAEVSNLLGQLASPAKEACMQGLRDYISAISEIYVPSTTAASRSEFVHLGLTDCTLAEKAGAFLVVSADARCVARLHAAGQDALNFNHIREQVTLR